MGFVVPGGLDDYVHGNRALVPRDRLASVLDKADVVIWTTEGDDQQAALLADPTVAQLKATKLKANVFTGKDLAGAIAFASVLSYPFVADQLTPLLAKTLG
jgi:iron complex transport system substrate-binding protein